MTLKCIRTKGLANDASAACKVRVSLQQGTLYNSLYRVRGWYVSYFFVYCKASGTFETSTFLASLRCCWDSTCTFAKHNSWKWCDNKSLYGFSEGSRVVGFVNLAMEVGRFIQFGTTVFETESDWFRARMFYIQYLDVNSDGLYWLLVWSFSPWSDPLAFCYCCFASFCCVNWR